MSISEFENMDINEELEFNNGVGDALKQKEAYSFSWKKTAIVLSMSIVVIVLVTFGVLEIGKSALNLNQHTDVAIESILLDEAVNESNAPNWDVLPEDNQNNMERPPADRDGATKKPIETIQATEVILPIETEKVVTPVKANQPASAKKVVYRVIAGSFSNINNAQTELRNIKSKGFNGYVWSLTSRDNKVSYKVQVGAFKTQESAQRLVNQLRDRGIQSFISKH
jgi:cell division septation protein DedD